MAVLSVRGVVRTRPRPGRASHGLPRGGAMDDVSMIVNMAELAAITREPWAREEMYRRGSIVAGRARAMAPRRTGSGSASIIAEPVIAPLTGWSCDVGWDHGHTYMRYTDRGTKYIRAQYYMERALEQGV